jgi:hypothetical protein
MSEVMPSAVMARWMTMAELLPATVTRAARAPWARLVARISVTAGPGIRIRIVVARTKAR